jgi:hypothetical protein
VIFSEKWSKIKFDKHGNSSISKKRVRKNSPGIDPPTEQPERGAVLSFNQPDQLQQQNGVVVS